MANTTAQLILDAGTREPTQRLGFASATLPSLRRQPQSHTGILWYVTVYFSVPVHNVWIS